MAYLSLHPAYPGLIPAYSTLISAYSMLIPLRRAAKGLKLLEAMKMANSRHSL
jgi:hypothetical protein